MFGSPGISVVDTYSRQSLENMMFRSPATVSNGITLAPDARTGAPASTACSSQCRWA